MVTSSSTILSLERNSDFECRSDRDADHLLLTRETTDRMLRRSGYNVGMVPHTIIKKSSAVTHAKISNVAQVKSSRLASSARYWVLIPEQMDVRMLREKTMLSCILSVVLFCSVQKIVIGRIARLASANVLNAGDHNSSY